MFRKNIMIIQTILYYGCVRMFGEKKRNVFDNAVGYTAYKVWDGIN